MLVPNNFTGTRQNTWILIKHNGNDQSTLLNLILGEEMALTQHKERHHGIEIRTISYQVNEYSDWLMVFCDGQSNEVRNKLLLMRPINQV